MATIKIHPDLNSLYIQPKDKEAVLCPVCQGSGYIYPAIDNCYPPSCPCHGCNGKGWVVI